MDRKFDTSNLSFDRLANVVSEEQVREIEIIMASSMEKPWIVDVLMYYLSDSNPVFTMYPQDIVEKLTDILIDFYNGSWSPFFDIQSGEIDLRTLIEYKQQDRFMIDAAYGMRVATKSEVDEGICNISDTGTVELVNNPTIKIEDSEYKFMCLFLWAVTGLWRYYIRAGYTCEFENGKPKEPEIKYISGIRTVLARMCELLNNTTYYSDTIAKLKSIKKTGNYKYPAYAPDEVVPDEKISFVINQVERMMPKRKSKTVYECYTILKKINSRNPKAFSTQDKITLRKGLYEIRHPEEFDGEAVSAEEVNETRELCEKLRQGVIAGHLRESDFAVKVASTIMKNNYRRCSDKQRKILLDAINKITTCENKQKQTEIIAKAIEDNATTKNDDLFSLAGMSDLLGKGLMS